MKPDLRRMSTWPRQTSGRATLTDKFSSYASLYEYFLEKKMSLQALICNLRGLILSTESDNGVRGLGGATRRFSAESGLFGPNSAAYARERRQPPTASVL